DAVVLVSPDEVAVGDTITVEGEDFEPNSTVTVTYTDADGNVVGTEDVDTDDDGAFQTAFEIPAGTALGDLEVHATDGDAEATDTSRVVDGDGSDEDGTDQDGTDQDGSDQDGAAEDGGDEDGSDQDGAEDPTLVIDPDEAGVGDEITVDGEGFEPNTTVVVTYTDSEGNVVGTQEVTTDDDGAFTTSFEIPEGTALGDLEVHASDGENEATETVAIIDT